MCIEIEFGVFAEEWVAMYEMYKLDGWLFNKAEPPRRLDNRSTHAEAPYDMPY